MTSSLVSGPVRISVPATSANLGPAFDCAGLALELRDVLEAEVMGRGDTAAAQVSVEGEGAGRVPLAERHLVVRAIRRALDALDVDPRDGAELRVHCRNVIPHGRGMGSSAAAIIGGLALGRALVPEGEHRLPDAELLRLALELEPHPDNVAAALLGGCTLAWREDEHDPRSVWAVRMSVHPSVRVAVAIPPAALSTSSARRQLPGSVPLAAAAFNSGRSALLVAALTSDPSLLMPATADRLHQEARRALYPESMALVDHLRDHGVPAVISGAGPTVLALSASPDVPSVDEQSVDERSAGQHLSARLRAACPGDWRVMDLEISPAGVMRV